jgi:hypothetical protein
MTYPLPFAEVSLRLDQLEVALEDAYKHLTESEQLLILQRIDYLFTAAQKGDYSE